MLYRTAESLRKRLIDAPESGMGYQIATVDQDRYLIFNAELAVSVTPEYAYRISDVEKPALYVIAEPFLSQGIPTLVGKKLRSPFFWIDEATAEALNRVVEELLDDTNAISLTIDLSELNGESLEVETHGSYPSLSRPDELFVRYSAFANDRRVHPDGSVQANTYATTETDAKHVPSGLSAAGRYALPNPSPAVHRFLLSPPSATPIHCGSAAPNFGQAGGGVEIRFTSSLPRGTANGPYRFAER